MRTIDVLLSSGVRVLRTSGLRCPAVWVQSEHTLIVDESALSELELRQLTFGEAVLQDPANHVL